MKTAPFILTPLVWRNVAALALVLFSCISMVGDLLGNRTLKGLGYASAIAPCPKVFCQNEGLEAFASEFVVEFETNGLAGSMPLTPELYSRLQGPYNRRNVYGAALSFGPKLPEPIWKSVFNYGFGPGGPLLAELGFPPETTNVAVIIKSKTRGRDDRWILKP